jgi:hypothetical protein
MNQQNNAPSVQCLNCTTPRNQCMASPRHCCPDCKCHWDAAEANAIAAYQEDVRRCPNYHDDTPRKGWGQLTEDEKHTWRMNPTPRTFKVNDWR